MAEEVEVGQESEVSVPPNQLPVDGPGSGRSELRKQLETNFEQDRKRTEKEQEPDRAKKPYVSRARQEAEGDDEQDEGAVEVEQAEGAEPQETPQAKPPEGWTKDAKAEWQNLPPQVQAAVSKRERDMAKGVEELKAKYAEVDQALQPRLDLIRRHGHTPAQAVNQLFAWFEALAANPDAAFPALAQSFQYDWKRLVPQGQQGQAQQQAQPQEKQPEGAIPAELQQYITGLQKEVGELKNYFNSQLGQVQNTFAQQSYAKTEETLNMWSKDKPHFEEVRGMMAHLIGSGAVPPLANGSADLDKAYDMALYAVPEVRQSILEEQEAKRQQGLKAKAAAEKKAQQEQADKARRASGSLSPGAPGAPNINQKGRKPGKSVKESLREAMEELRS